MTRALGYIGKKNPTPPKLRWNTKEKKRERDPDAMDVDFTQMTLNKKKQLMKSGSCFRCEKQGHLSRNCPTKNKSAVREAKMITEQETPKSLKTKNEEPPRYETLLKQINTCSMEDRQKLLEVFSQDGDNEGKDF